MKLSPIQELAYLEKMFRVEITGVQSSWLENGRVRSTLQCTNAAGGHSEMEADISTEARESLPFIFDEPKPKHPETNDGIARRCRVSQPFVSNLRNEILTSISRSEKSSERAYQTKHGTTSTMQTENIGKKAERPQQKQSAWERWIDGEYPVEDWLENIFARHEVKKTAMVKGGCTTGFLRKRLKNVVAIPSVRGAAGKVAGKNFPRRKISRSKTQWTHSTHQHYYKPPELQNRSHADFR